MELKLEVVLSSSIKRKKPWPRLCWLGQDKESVFLLDDKRISEINMVSGRTKKKHPKLYSLLNSVVTMTASQNGMWLCGLLASGKLFLWNKDKDLLKTSAEVPDVAHIITIVQGNPTRLSLQVSGDGMRVLLVIITGQVLLWECTDITNLMGVRDGTVSGRWAHIQPLQDTILPCLQDKEASQHSIFVKTEAIGDVCLSAIVFTSGMKLIVTCLKIQWEEGHVRAGPEGYSIWWTSKTYPMSRLSPPCHPVKSRGTLVPAFSPDGQLLAIVLNQRQPRATQVLFVSTQNFVSISSHLGGCGSKKLDIPSKYIRSYWVGSASWTPGGLFLACVLKRGSLLLLARLGGLLCLTSSGCNVDFGPAQFLPLHPLITYCPPMSAVIGEATRSSSSMSQQDILRQRYSVTWHPRLLYLIVSDGYMVTVLRVLDKPSPTLLLKTLLNDSRADLEKASQILDKSQVHVRVWLESVSCLGLDDSREEIKPIVRPGTNTVASVTSPGSTLPLFLQDNRTLGGTMERHENTLLEDESDFEGPPAGYNAVDGGRLEFASMFDTLHALDAPTDSGLFSDPDLEKHSAKSDRKSLLRHRDLRKIQARLLTAWAFGMCPGDAVENRSHLLKQTLLCMVRFAALLRLIPSSVVQRGKKNTTDSARIMHLLKAILSFLPWDITYSPGSQCLGEVVEFSKRVVRLLLTPHPESYQTGLLQLSSHSLSTALVILRLVSDSLEHTYSLQQRTLWSTAEKESLSELNQLRPSDIYCVPLLQDEKHPDFIHQVQTSPHRPSSRMFGVWQWIYKVAQQYVEELQGFKGCDNWEEEQQRLSVILSQIQLSLQATGERLEPGPALLSYAGENYFLLGLYQKSADTCCSEIWESITKCSDRSVFQQTRLCLALLYGLLSQYHLKEAQGLGDHMARLILYRSGHHMDNVTSAADFVSSSWLPMDLHIDAAYAVVQSLGRFMASYFTNQPLYVLPPHNVAVLPPLHLPQAAGLRCLPLCQEEVAIAVRRQHLSEAWTVDYAQDLLLLGGLLPETVWLAYHLGDWKSAASLSLAYTNYCYKHFDFTRLRRRDFHLPTHLEPASIFQAELDCLLDTSVGSEELTENNQDKSFTDPLEGEEWDLLHASIQDILKASVMTGVNIMPSSLSSLLVTAKDLCSCLPVLVPSGLYLPSPPLYCPQPSPNTQDSVGTFGQFTEVVSRHKVSRVLQRLLLLLSSAHCCHPAAQWYIRSLRRARHLLYKIKKNYSYPSAPAEEKPFPEDLMKFVSRSGFFKPRRRKDLQPDIIQTIICFRELCGLCWMLHVRDLFSLSCRKYQAVRKAGADEQISGGSEMRSACVDALHWGCRYLPFSHFLNADEILQDILLSLMSELPPDSLVADMLIQAFPQQEESVRIPLREKYNSLLQRLRRCTAHEGEEEDANELMRIQIQDKRRQRRKHLARLKRHLAPLELCLWEKDEQEEDKHGGGMVTQLSMDRSLSNSTLNDCGFPLMYSDGDTAENTSDTFSTDKCYSSTSRSIKAKIQERRTASRMAIKNEKVIQEEQSSNSGDIKEKDKPSLPVVGTWEFELEDDEYLNFLEVFLSYVVEKDNTDRRDSGSDLPLLKGFSSQLRESELHSVTFDVLTTMHRRQREGHHPTRRQWDSDTPVFRAGCCYKPINHDGTPETQGSTVGSETNISNNTLSVSSLPGLRTGSQKGLFGSKQQANVSTDGRIMRGYPSRCSFLTRQPSNCLVFGSSTSLEVVTELQQVLDPKLEAHFPELGRLLEWMVRWSDRAVLQGHHGKKKKERGERVRGTSAEGVMIRVKISAPAVLTSLILLEHRYTTIPGPDRNHIHKPIPETLQTVGPELETETNRRLERASSTDTGYPGSANTPLTVADHNLQQEVSLESHSDDAEELIFHRIPHLDDQNQATYDAEMRPPTAQQSLLEDLDLTPEKEGKATDSEGLEVPSTVSSGDISEDICTSGTSFRLSHLDCAEKPEDVLISTSPALESSSHPELQTLTTVPPTAPVQRGPSDPIEVQLTTTTVTPPECEPHTFTSGAPAAVSSAPQPSLPTHALPFGQHLGDELVRLVQYINFVSLRDVLGASFSTLSASHPNNQSNTNSLHPNVSLSCATHFIHQQDALPAQTNSSVETQTQVCRLSNPQFSQVPANMNVNHPTTTSLTGEQCPTPRNLFSTGNTAGVSYQEIQPLSVHAESPERRFRESMKLIPSSQGLLTTMESSHSMPSAPAALHCNDSMQTNRVSQILGLRLLQLHHPLSSQQMSAHCSTTQSVQKMHSENSAAVAHPHQQFKVDKQSDFKDTTKEKRRRSSVLKRQQNVAFDNYQSNERTPRITQPQNGTREPSFNRSTIQESFLLPPVLSFLKPAPTQIPHQVHFQSDAHSSSTLPVPLVTLSKPSTIVTPPVGETRIKLLHLDSGQKMILPSAVPPSQVARITTLEELAHLAGGRQTPVKAGLRLLKANPYTESTKNTTTSPHSNSSKRQNRREVKMTSARKTEVTFSPSEANLATHGIYLQPTDDAVNEKPAPTDEIIFRQSIGAGSSEILQTRHRLSHRDVVSTAELFAFAATCKRPAQCHDAYTNTNPDWAPTQVDNAVCPQVSVIAVNTDSQCLEDLHFFREPRVKDKEETSKERDKNPDVHDHHLMCVMDTEVEALHQDLPPYLGPEAQDGPSIHTSSPASAHHFGTSVVGGAAAHPHPSPIIPEDPMKATIHPDKSKESPFSPLDSKKDQERIPSGDMAGLSDIDKCQANNTEDLRLHRTFSTSINGWFSVDLPVIDARLADLQNIADSLEKDSPHARKFVHTIGVDPAVLAPQVKTNVASSKMVDLSVPWEAWRSLPDTFTQTDAYDDEENEYVGLVIHNESSTPEGKPPVLPSTSADIHPAGPSHLYIPASNDELHQELNEELTLSSGAFSPWVDDPETVEILNALVKEGILSSADMELSKSQTVPHSSGPHQQQSNRLQDVPPDDERRQLRIWMRKKQRERMAVFRKHREALREKERIPYSASARKTTNKSETATWKFRREKEKSMLLKHYNQRIAELLSLVGDFSPSHPVVSRPTRDEGVPTQPSAVAPSGATHSQPADDTKRILKSPSGQAQAHVHQRTAEVHDAKRLGLHRKVTFLPSDRLSQMTRRGMLTDTKSHAKMHTVSPEQLQQGARQRNTGLNNIPSGGTVIRTERIKTEREVMPGPLDEKENDASVSEMELDWLDNLSDCSSTVLSIDWAAVEQILAEDDA
ncbi:ciliogenesis and planar polarity effector 1 isoform X2 [Thalassophryne amazonica]|uniref:ciliogenesis and planar polarity effector 1 isoform X2 n=1 Tax=Thalassophryne amazonica TaxID=390379 RepID=UPI001470D4F7|nr:ciliogenesis and planar polarity effector 1 isoform X2 [Thalassophryne amazonica]